MEQGKGIEPSSSDWKSEVIPLYEPCILVPQARLELAKAWFLRPLGVPISTSHRGNKLSQQFLLECVSRVMCAYVGAYATLLTSSSLLALEPNKTYPYCQRACKRVAYCFTIVVSMQMHVNYFFKSFLLHGRLILSLRSLQCSYTILPVCCLVNCFLSFFLLRFCNDKKTLLAVCLEGLLKYC